MRRSRAVVRRSRAIGGVEVVEEEEAQLKVSFLKDWESKVNLVTSDS